MNIVLALSLLVAGCTTILATSWPMKDGVPCACTRLHDPVCGSDGQDYPNRQCARTCGKVRSFRRDTCARQAPCGCSKDIVPVCARRPDGTLDDFINLCEAECENGAIYSRDGPCPKPSNSLPNLWVEQLRELRALGEERERKAVCACPAIYSPVCGRKNNVWREYASQCNADCEGVETTTAGPCPKPCVCHKMLRLVCARKPDGTLRDYGNDCVAHCDNAVIVSSGRCPAKPDNSLPHHVKRTSVPVIRCACTYLYSPVCAEHYGDRRGYPNRCTAECANATYLHDGSCDGPVQPAQLPVLHNVPDDSVVAQLPWLGEDSEDSNDLSDVDSSDDSAESDNSGAKSYHGFPFLFKRRVLH